jgi:LAO/AO transport system kinase
MLELTDKDESIIRALAAGCVRTCARVITRIENCEEGLESLLRSLYMAGGDSKIVGITGPPGAGKSTLIGKLVGVWRRRGYRVAVLAIDPSSPFTGGAILGDRLRMVSHCADEGVFIRSMASRGQLGGLAKTSGDVLMVLGAMPWDFIIVETVGTGQSETDIMHHASVVVLVLTPMGGDDIQTAKAGINEIGDIYVVNKGDHPDADQVCRQLNEMLAIGYRLNLHQTLRPPVVKTQSLQGEGIETLAEKIELRFSHLAENPELRRCKLRKQIKYRITDIVHELVMRKIHTENELADSLLNSVITRESDPYDLAMKLFPVLNKVYE